MALARKFGRWIWAGGSDEAHWARERRLPFWERPWFTRFYRIAFVTGWVAVIAFFSDLEPGVGHAVNPS